MNRKINLKKLEADKIALLGLFIFALLIAHFIVSVKSAIIFSEPIELAHTGLSVSVPLGNGWRSEKQWQYQQNKYILSSNFSAGSDNPTALVYYKYLLADEAIAPQRWFEQKAAEIDGTIVEINQEQIDALTIDWVHIEKPEVPFDGFFGTIELPNNRRLNIEVRHRMTSEIDLGEKVFRQLLSHLNYEDNQLLNAGIEVVTSIKTEGIDNFLDNQNRQRYFFIKDSGRQTIGFMIDVLIDSEQDAPYNIQAAGHLYGRQLSEQATRFRCRNNLDEFIWQSETSSPSGRNRREVILDENGIMEVVDSKTQTKSRCLISPASIPDIFTEQILRRMLEISAKNLIVDIIDSDGKIVPTLASVIEITEDMTAGQEAVYAFKLDFMDGRGFSQTVYLDDKRQITGATIEQDKRYILESTSIENIKREFPKRADFISQINNLLGDNIL